MPQTASKTIADAMIIFGFLTMYQKPPTHTNEMSRTTIVCQLDLSAWLTNPLFAVRADVSDGLRMPSSVILSPEASVLKTRNCLRCLPISLRQVAAVHCLQIF